MQKSYAVNWENGEIVSVVVDGVRYDTPDQIADLNDRAQILRLMSKAADDDFEESFADWQRPSTRFPLIFGAIFLGVAILMLAIATISVINTRQKIAEEESVPGRVVDLTMRQNQNGQTFYYPLVEITQADGTLRTIQLVEGSWPAAYEVGQVVSVLYDPARPQQARIQSRNNALFLWLVPIITGFLGLIFLVVGLLVMWFLRPSPLSLASQ